MYRLDGEQCSKCGKLFNPSHKTIKMVDLNGNELHIDLCEKCEYDFIISEVMESKHINRKEADKYIWDTINEMIYNVRPYNDGDTLVYDYWNRPFTMEQFDGLVEAVKNNEIRTN